MSTPGVHTASATDMCTLSSPGQMTKPRLMSSSSLVFPSLGATAASSLDLASAPASRTALPVIIVVELAT